MQPTSKQLIESISWSLDERVAPHVDDKWGSSTLRSVGCLLQHLGARVELEGQLLFDDNADLDTLVAAVGEALDGAAGAGSQSADGFRDACKQTWREVGVYPSVESMAVENDTKRTALDELIAAIAPPADAAATNALELIDAYLQRRLQRDQPMFLPAFMGSTF